MEGEFDAIALASLGLNAVAIAGTGGVKKLEELAHYRRIYLAFDDDMAGHKATETGLKMFKPGHAKAVTLSPDPNDWLASLEVQEPKAFWNMAHGSKLVERAADHGEAMVEYMDDPDAKAGEPTGIVGLDSLLGGGKRLGEVTVLHAEAKSGKNTLWHQMMYNWLERDIAIGYASREISPSTEVLPQLFSIHLNKNLWATGLADGDYHIIEEKLESWPLYFAKGYGTFLEADIVEWMEALSYQGVQYYFFDHLHYMLEDSGNHAQAAEMARLFKTMAKRLNVHVDLIVQPNKLYDGAKVSRQSLKGCSGVEQALDNLLLFNRIPHEDGKKSNRSDLEVSLIRSKLGKSGLITLEYDPANTTMKEIEFE